MLKKLLLTLVALCHFFLYPCALWAAPQIPPRPTRSIYVQDLAGVLDENTKSTINGYGSTLDGRTGAQIVVLTVPSLNGAPIEDYSLAVLRGWGIGSKEKNNGVLLLIAVNDRKSRIEVGYGLEGALPDGLTGRMQDRYLIPYMKQGDYSRGVLNTYAALLQTVSKEYGIEVQNMQPEAAPDAHASPLTLLDKLLLFGGLVVLILVDQFLFHGAIVRFLLYLLFFRGGRGGGGGGFGGGSHYGGGSGGGGGSSRSW